MRRMLRLPGAVMLAILAWLAVTAVAHARAEPWLGVWIDGVLAHRPASDGVTQETVYITVVNRGGPAEAAGLLPLDVIHAIDGRPVRSLRDAVCLIQTAWPNQIVLLTIVRQGAMRTFPVMLAEWPADKAKPPRLDCPPPETS